MTTYLSKVKLLEALVETGMEPQTGFMRDTFDSWLAQSVTDAQRILMDNGYWLDGTTISEGQMYLMRFRSPDADDLFSVKLRFRSKPEHAPLLALMYEETPRHYTRSFLIAPPNLIVESVKTLGSMEARMLLLRVRHNFPDRRRLWAPVLPDSPLTM